ERACKGDYRLEFHLAPPLLSRVDPLTGRPIKRRFGPWIMHAFKLLARLKGLRGTALDPFGNAFERKEERRLITDYETVLDEIVRRLTPETHDLAVELASLPEAIRGYGPVKADAIAQADERRDELLAALREPAPKERRAA
ncbi:MAG: indolepyruvate ferredoxin oxidoreductase family protein, partial [Hyphomicrobiales bacterium]|nr:indolepyruvate ferredoxin oxidoreductase family protein [Hyphomicrobiales bacterium]